jgi:hypothetical protein
VTKEPARPSSKIYIGIIGAVVLAVVAVFMAVYFTQQQLNTATITDQKCRSQQQTTHTVTIKNDQASPSHISAQQCDKLTIINQDDETRLVAFGLHDAHTSYDGITEKPLQKGQSLTVTLVQTGNFRVHDHVHDEVQATFTVTAR